MSVVSSNATWLAIVLPRLSTDRLIRSGRAPEDKPLAIYAKEANAFLLTGVDACASALGLRLAMSLADARALHPGLAIAEAEPNEDARALDHIAAWCERFTPVVAVDPPYGLFLDITGCAHLFGGEAALRDQIVRRLDAQGFAARGALASTPGAAWALARYSSSKQGDDLASLPIEALRLDEEAVSLLRRLGLKTIGQLIATPRTSFAARAGERALLRLDQALGRAPEALKPRRPPPPVFALRRFLEPLFHVEMLLDAAETLCIDVIAQLDRRGAGARHAVLHLYGVDGRDHTIAFGLSQPTREVRTLMRLLREKLARAAETLNAEFGIEAARLDIVAFERIEGAPRALLETEETQAGADKIAAIVDVLSVRLGPKRVLRPKLSDVHAPEKAGGWSVALLPLSLAESGRREGRANDTPPEQLNTPHSLTPSPSRDREAIPLFQDSPAAKRPVGRRGNEAVMRRPLTLFSPPHAIEAIATVPDGPPIRFRWRRVLREVARAEGPERISGDWMGGGATRDYYRVEDREGRRYWLYREGLYGEDEAPRWFVHGLFA